MQPQIKTDLVNYRCYYPLSTYHLHCCETVALCPLPNLSGGAASWAHRAQQHSAPPRPKPWPSPAHAIQRSRPASYAARPMSHNQSFPGTVLSQAPNSDPGSLAPISVVTPRYPSASSCIKQHTQ